MELYTAEISQELKKVEQVLISSVKSKNSLLQSESRRLINLGGKRLRPAMLINSAKFGQYDEKKVIELSVALELLHLATLVHDDVVDESELRRGGKATHKLYGNKIAIFTGDFLVTKAILMVSKYSDDNNKGFEPKYIALVLKNICEGEVEQYESRYKTDVSINQYLKRIKYKTALLFTLACQLGAEVSNCDIKTTKYLKNFGMALGNAFQIQDDILDFEGHKDKLGKPTLHDIKVGIYTLPVIYAINSHQFEESLKELLSRNSNEDHMEDIVEIVENSGGIEYSKKLLNEYIKRAEKWLNKLPYSEYRLSLQGIITNLINREK